MVTFGANRPRLVPRVDRGPASSPAPRARRGVAPGSVRAHALARAGRVEVARQSNFVAVISDFREQEGWTRALGPSRRAARCWP
jgi:hypothetical protein